MYLVTGATGHIGNTLIRVLLARDPRVKIRAFVLPNSDIKPLEGLAVEIVYGNVLDPASIAPAMDGIDVVFHLAGIIAIRAGQDELVKKVNIQGAVNVARAALAAKVRRLVHVASIHIFERIPTGVIDETIPLVTAESAVGVYDYTKAEAVRQIRKLAGEGLDVVIACPTGVFGPNDYLGSEIGVVIRQYIEKSNHFVLKGGYNWVDARDVAQGLIGLAERGTKGEIYLLGGHFISVEEYAHQVGKVMGKEQRITHIPYIAALVTAHVLNIAAKLFKITPQLTPYALRTTRDNANISSQKAADAIGYTARSIEETFRDLVRWYQEHPQA